MTDKPSVLVAVIQTVVWAATYTLMCLISGLIALSIVIACCHSFGWEHATGLLPILASVGYYASYLLLERVFPFPFPRRSYDKPTKVI